MMSNPYKEYLIEKYGYDGAIEEGESFLLYRLYPETSSLSIGDLYVPGASRRNGDGTRLADRATLVAIENNLKYLTCQTELTGKGDNVSMMAILSYGFIPYDIESTGKYKAIKFYKEVQL
jgi:hypothetical protein